MNSSDDENSNFQIGCHHDSCSDFNKTNFIDELCQRYDVKTSQLKEFLNSPKLDTGETEQDVLEKIKHANRMTSSEDISEICICLAQFTDSISAERGVKELSKHTGIGITALKREVNNAKAELRKSTQVKNGTEECDRTIIFQSMDFTEQIDRTIDAIVNHNEIEPNIFSMADGRRVRIREQNNANCLETLDTKSLSAELNKIIKCIKGPSNQNGELEVAPFRDLVSHIEGMSPSPFFPLESVIRVPVFSKDGKLRTKRGYDRELSCFIDCNFTPLEVAEIPLQQDVEEAKQWLLEVIYDFPFSDKFDGTEMQEVKIDGDVNLERGPSSRAAAIALILQPFMKALYTGSAPAFCVDKPVAGTGAGLFVDTISLISEGRRANATPVGPNNEELRKLITSALISCQSLIFLDNIRSSYG